jgi:hypothetical protein
MPSAEPARHAFYSVLEEVIGPDNAKTLMTHLPLQPADEVATKADIAHLEARFDRLEVRFDQLQRTLVLTVVGSMTALTAIFTLVVGLLG